MSKTVRVNEKGMEVKKPFSFVNLGVNNIGPEDVMESDSTFTYIQGTTNPSIMAPLDNVYDSLYKHEMLSRDYLYVIDNPNDFEYVVSNQRIAETLIDRAVSAITQNIIIIYNNGLKKFMEPFIIDNPEKDYYAVSTLTDGIDYTVKWKDIFTARDEVSVVTDPMYCGGRFGSFKAAENNDDIITNSLEAIGNIVRAVSDKYDHIIKWHVNDKLDLKAFAKYILDADDVDFDTVDESQYIGVVFGALNQVATDDLNKVREIAEIELMQATSQYFRDSNKKESQK